MIPKFDATAKLLSNEIENIITSKCEFRTTKKLLKKNWRKLKCNSESTILDEIPHKCLDTVHCKLTAADVKSVLKRLNYSYLNCQLYSIFIIRKLNNVRASLHKESEDVGNASTSKESTTDGGSSDGVGESKSEEDRLDDSTDLLEDSESDTVDQPLKLSE